jgi:hypothetical protein
MLSDMVAVSVTDGFKVGAYGACCRHLKRETIGADAVVAELGQTSVVLE